MSIKDIVYLLYIGLTSDPSFDGHTLEDVVAECVTLADALIEELQKKDDNANV